MEAAVKRAVSAIWDRYFEPITLDELASSAFVSRFHFLRVFDQITGVTPGRYLSAVRMFEAKRLLLTSSLKVSDIVCCVGYSSVGTFTTRFTRLVGMTPSQYRQPRVGELLIAVGPKFSRVPSVEAVRGVAMSCAPVTQPAGGSIVGTIELPPEDAPANVYVGVFAEPVPQAAPVAYKYLHNAGTSKLSIGDVPAGRWVVIAVAEPHAGALSDRQELLVSHAQPVTVRPGGIARVRLHLRGPGAIDPPMAISLATLVSPRPGPASVPQRRLVRAVA